MVREAVARISDEVPQRLQVRTNPSVRQQASARLELAADPGFEVFQEKEGFRWSDSGAEDEVPNRLVVHTVHDVGRRHYREVLAGVGRETWTAMTPGIGIR